MIPLIVNISGSDKIISNGSILVQTSKNITTVLWLKKKDRYVS